MTAYSVTLPGNAVSPKIALDPKLKNRTRYVRSLVVTRFYDVGAGVWFCTARIGCGCP